MQTSSELHCQWWSVQFAVVIGQTAADKMWEVPGKKFANRKGRPETKKKKKKTIAAAAADETCERRKSLVSPTAWNYETFG